MPSALARIQFRFGPASDWMAANPILLEGEPGFEGDTGKVKVGDGIRHWVALPYLGSGSGSSAVTSVNAKTGAVLLIPEDVPGLPAFIKSVIANTLIAGPNVGITSNTALGTVTIAAAGSSGGGGGSGSGVISINGKTGGVTVDGRDGITVTQEQSVPTIHIGVTTGGGYGGTQTLPSAPMSVAGNPEDSMAVVSWSEPVSSGSSDITDYVVQYSSDFGATWVTAPDGVESALSSAVTGLSNGQDYVFRVAAVNSYGRGPFSAQSTAVRPFAPSDVLAGVTLSNASVDSGAPAGTVVGLLSPVPPTIAGVTYSLPSTTPGNASFTIFGRELRVGQSPDSTSTPTILVSVAATPESGSEVTADFSISITPTPLAPQNAISITRQPQSATASGGAAAFSVVAESSLRHPLSYQWQTRPAASTVWSDVSGATGDTLSLTGLTYAANNATKYRVIVSSPAADPATSSEACLGVPPDGWRASSGVPGATKAFPVDDGIMVATHDALYWTADGSTHQARTPLFPVDISTNDNGLLAAGWTGKGVRAGVQNPRSAGGWTGYISRYRYWNYSSDNGSSWAEAASPYPSYAYSEPVFSSAGGFATNAFFEDMVPGAIAGANWVKYSLNGLVWIRSAKIPAGVPDARVPLGTVALTDSKCLLFTTTHIFSIPLSPTPAAAWSAHVVPAGVRAAWLRSKCVIEAYGLLWWFGVGNTYLSCTTSFTGWSEHQLPFTDTYVGAAAGGGMIVAIGTSRAAVCTNPATHTWTAEPLGLTNPVAITYFNNKFFVYSDTRSSVREVLPEGALVGCGVPGAVPEAPQQLAVTTSDGSAVLSWREPASSGTAPVTGYSVQYRTSPAGTWSAAASVTDLVANVTALENGTTYDFRVCAVNSEGPGPFASVTDTPHGPPAQAPTAVTAVGVAPDVTALNSTLYGHSIKGGYAWRRGDHTRFSVSWEAPAEGPTPSRYIVEMKSVYLQESCGFPWQPSGYDRPMFDVSYSGTTAIVRPLYDIYILYASALLWNRNLLWSFRVAGVTGDGPGAWSDWSVPTALMPAAASTPSNPAGGGVATLPLPPAPVVAAGTYSTHKSCYLYGGTMQAAWWDVVTLSWPSTGSTLTGVEVQNHHNAGTVLGVSYPAGWSPLEQATAAPPSSTAYTAIANLVRTHQFFRVASPTSVELYLRRGATPCAQVAPPATSLYWSTFGTSRTLYRVILKTAGGNSPGGEVTIPIP